MFGARVWFCCQCKEGPNDTKLYLRCVGCNHTICSYCTVIKGTQRTTSTGSGTRKSASDVHKRHLSSQLSTTPTTKAGKTASKNPETALLHSVGSESPKTGGSSSNRASIQSSRLHSTASAASSSSGFLDLEEVLFNKVCKECLELFKQEKDLLDVIGLMKKMDIVPIDFFEDELRLNISKVFSILESEAMSPLQIEVSKWLYTHSNRLAILTSRTLITDLVGETQSTGIKEMIPVPTEWENRDQSDQRHQYIHKALKTALNPSKPDRDGLSKGDSGGPKYDLTIGNLDFSAIQDFIIKIRLAKIIQRRLVASSWNKISCLWLNELGIHLPREIRELATINKDKKYNDVFKPYLVDIDPVKILDLIKIAFETFSGISWDWWPLDQPRKPLAKHETRLIWRAATGRLNWVDISAPLANKHRILLNNAALMSLPSKAAVDSTQGYHSITSALTTSTSSPESNSGLQSLRSSLNPASRTSSTSPGMSQSILAQKAQPALALGSDSVLVCGFRGAKLYAEEVKTFPQMDDKNFLLQLKAKQYNILGFNRYYFDLQEFWYCQFARVRSKGKNRVDFSCHELPCSKTYHSCITRGVVGDYNCTKDYDYKKATRDPQLSRNSWEEFHEPELATGRQDILPYIPKRTKPFNLGRACPTWHEDLWGLEIVRRPSFLKVMISFAAVVLTSVAFWISWIVRFPGDWQNAATLSFFALGGTAVILPLSRQFKLNWCNKSCSACV